MRVKHGKKLHCPGKQVAVLQELNLIHEILHLNGSCDEVNEKIKAVDSLEGSRSLARNKRRRTYDCGSLLLKGLGYHAGLLVVFRDNVLKVAHASEHIRLVIRNLLNLETAVSLKDGRNRAVRHFQCLDYFGDSAVAIQVVPTRVFNRKVVLGYCTYECIVLFRILYKADRLFPAYRYGIDSTGKQDGVSQREYGEGIRKL